VLGVTDVIFYWSQSGGSANHHFPIGTNDETGIVKCKSSGVPN
jgi:hypothetical protein